MNLASNLGGAPRILVVDDALANLELLTVMLERQGYIVHPAPSGELALQAAIHEPPDLILLDINMPEMSGYDLCERLKADPVLSAVPVIFVSGLNETEDKVKGFDLGAVDFITKPFQFREVEARVRTHLELARLRRDLQRHNAHLEEVVVQRTCELSEAKQRLAILDQAKTDFLRLIAHEIRTPLNGILGIAELLLETSNDSAVTEYAELYARSRRRLMTLVDDSLLFSQIGLDADAEAHPQCPLETLLNQARTEAEVFAKSRGVQLAPMPPDLGWVHGSAKHLVRALQSLLETAVKFAHAESIVRLGKTTAPGKISLIIEADGLEIPTNALPRFFSLLDISEPITPGGDLGLAPPLAERIVTLYGGSVSVENMVPTGIRLVVNLKTTEITSA